ncbi:MAG: hypothetical protein QOF30_1532, partial [Acidimicrobiaceae bacterium]|nr:hypothetical protein [Acidimicrobiaceae bacterium]
PVRAAFDDLVEAAAHRPPIRIVLAELGARAGAVGAALLALEAEAEAEADADGGGAGAGAEAEAEAEAGAEAEADAGVVAGAEGELPLLSP